MKKLVVALVVLLTVSLTMQAQKRGKKGDRERLTPEQRTELAVKKMTLKLDLTPNQVSQIKPLLTKKAEERKLMHEKRKALKESGKKLTADERFEMKSKKLDKMIAFKAEMKQILNEKQFEKFEKMSDRKMHKMKKKAGKKRHKKKRNHKKDTDR